ncbi:MAG: class II aldolase [Clostridia bacterium]|nr:class II aldolase [Clostridia bacterium]
MIIDELVGFSNLYGSNEELVLAGGGNTSAKDGDIMYIKGSGTRLCDITAEGFVAMSRSKIAEIFTKTYPDNDKEREALSLADLMAAKLPNQENKRPSVETTLHSLFPQRFVLHLHPALINGVTCSNEGKIACDRLFGNRVLWIDPVKPGYTLAKICYDTLAEYKNATGNDADIVLLANHGIFVADDTVEGLGDKLFFVMDKIREEITNEPDFSVGEFDGEKGRDIFNEISEVFGEDSVVTYEPSALSLEYAKNKESFDKIYYPFNPDQVVYCKPYPVYVEVLGEVKGIVEEYKAKNGFLPKIVFVKDCGLFGVDYSQKGSETAVALFNDAMKISVYARDFGGGKPMSPDLTDFIVNWEAESYRSKQ